MTVSYQNDLLVDVFDRLKKETLYKSWKCMKYSALDKSIQISEFVFFALNMLK